tara:strand:+ start:1133 stop:2197 length:1065 start_codon:yes stop_codon:yes gene_type:complete
MPTTSLTVDNELLSATSIEAASEARDLRHIVTPFLAEHARVHGEGQPSKGSGHKWIGAFSTGDHSSPTKRQTGYEQMNLSFSGVLTPMVLTPAEVSYPIGISAVEEDLNGGDLQTIELASRRAKTVMNKAKRDFEQHMLFGNVSQYEDWYSLNGEEEGDGFLEALAPGTQNNIIGGFSKGTHLALPGANNQFFDVGSSFNTSGLTGIYRTLIKAKARAVDDLAGLTIFMSERCMENYKRTLQANERYMVMDGDDRIDGANMNLMVSGLPAHVSTHLGQATTVSAGSITTSMLMVDLNAIYVCWSKVIRDGYFSMSDFANIGNGYNVRVAEVLVRGQLWAESFASSAFIANAETF